MLTRSGASILLDMEHDEVHDRASFVKYVAALRAQLADPVASTEFENVDLLSFLEAMQAWATDWRKSADGNPWRHAADVLTAALIYE